MQVSMGRNIWNCRHNHKYAMGLCEVEGLVMWVGKWGDAYGHHHLL